MDIGAWQLSLILVAGSRNILKDGNDWVFTLMCEAHVIIQMWYI